MSARMCLNQHWHCEHSSQYFRIQTNENVQFILWNVNIYTLTCRYKSWKFVFFFAIKFYYCDFNSNRWINTISIPVFAHRTEMNHLRVQIFQMRILREQQKKQLLIQICDECIFGPNIFNECSELLHCKKKTNEWTNDRPTYRKNAYFHAIYLFVCSMLNKLTVSNMFTHFFHVNSLFHYDALICIWKDHFYKKKSRKNELFYYRYFR